jgi:hypothetical protein
MTDDVNKSIMPMKVRILPSLKEQLLYLPSILIEIHILLLFLKLCVVILRHPHPTN